MEFKRMDGFLKKCILLYMFTCAFSCKNKNTNKISAINNSVGTETYNCFYTKYRKEYLNELYRCFIDKKKFLKQDYWILHLSQDTKKNYLVEIEILKNSFFKIRYVSYVNAKITLDSIQKKNYYSICEFKCPYAEERLEYYLVFDDKTKIVSLDAATIDFFKTEFWNYPECLNEKISREPEIWTIEKPSISNQPMHVVSRENNKSDNAYMKHIQTLLDSCDISEYKITE